MAPVTVLAMTHDRDQHLLRQADSLLHTMGWDECVVTFVDQPREPWTAPPPGFRAQHLAAGGLALAAGRNAGAAGIEEGVLVFLDVDCLVEPTTITTLAGQCRPGRLVMATPHYLPPGWEPAVDPGTVALAHPAREALTPGPSEAWQMFWSLGFAIMARDFHRLGGFDESYRGYGGEDTDFAFRCRDAGMEFFLSEARVLHQAHAVHRPPLQHFDSIVVNARRFRERWGRWPMEGWLAAFEARGLVRVEAEEIVVLRHPTPDEVAASRLPAAAF